LLVLIKPREPAVAASKGGMPVGPTQHLPLLPASRYVVAVSSGGMPVAPTRCSHHQPGTI
jgi:hypothetical protein